MTWEEDLLLQIVDQFAEKCPNITSLTLSGSSYNDVFPDIFGKRLKEILPKFSKLDELEFQDCEFVNFPYLEHSLNITKLGIHDCVGFGLDEFLFVAEKFTNLKSLWFEQIMFADLYGENSIDTEELGTILASFKSQNLSEITMFFHDEPESSAELMEQILPPIIKEKLNDIWVQIHWDGYKIDLNKEAWMEKIHLSSENEKTEAIYSAITYYESDEEESEFNEETETEFESEDEDVKYVKFEAQNETEMLQKMKKMDINSKESNSQC